MVLVETIPSHFFGWHDIYIHLYTFNDVYDIVLPTFFKSLRSTHCTLWWTNIAMENGPVEIVDFPINKMVDLSIAM